MSSLSKVVVSGRIVKAPEKRFTAGSNVAMTEFAIAVESLPRQDGQKETTAVKVITWRELAERCAEQLKKDDLVCVDGRLQINASTQSDGQKRRDVEIDAVNVENLGSLMGSEGVQMQIADKTPPKVGVAAQGQAEDLDMIFAEDEIPF